MGNRFTLHRARNEVWSRIDETFLGVAEPLQEINKHHFSWLVDTLHNSLDLKGLVLASRTEVSIPYHYLPVHNHGWPTKKRQLLAWHCEVTVGENVSNGYCVTAIMSQQGGSFPCYMAQQYTITDGWVGRHQHQSVSLKGPFHCMTALLPLFNLSI